ncbi:hypothetical protein [Turicimonas muris]|uniref:hypothetical protein n=1 Tax=Turicimonas muris TaxID=1796652 RepID=UPI0026DEDE3B|nr:hypothetical protein [Turicimonas muris]
MFKDTVAEFVEEERRSIKPPTVEISTEDFLKIVETLSDPFNGLKKSTKSLCANLICDYKIPMSEEEREYLAALRKA